MEDLLTRPAQSVTYDFERYLVESLDICLDAASRPSKKIAVNKILINSFRQGRGVQGFYARHLPKREPMSVKSRKERQSSRM